MNTRGSYKFEVEETGNLVENESNVEKCQRMFLDWAIIQGNGGPGTSPGTNGSWHVLCHLAGAGVLLRTQAGERAWAGITYDPNAKSYVSTISVFNSGRVTVLPLSRMDSREIIAHSVCCGFVEGASKGHILDRAANDPGDSELVDRRQDYDQDVNSKADGGPVWEHWTSSRDIVSPTALGTGMLRAYFSLVSLLGGIFPGTVARGRFEPEYGHTIQLCAMVEAGFISPEDARWSVTPTKIPQAHEPVLLEARPDSFAAVAEQLVRGAGDEKRYFMYERKIESFLTLPIIDAIGANLRPFASQGKNGTSK